MASELMPVRMRLLGGGGRLCGRRRPLGHPSSARRAMRCWQEDGVAVITSHVEPPVWGRSCDHFSGIGMELGIAVTLVWTESVQKY